jgi:hypothetical protein
MDGSLSKRVVPKEVLRQSILLSDSLSRDAEISGVKTGVRETERTTWMGTSVSVTMGETR